MRKSGGNIHTIDILFPLLFILLFCFCALLVVLQGARIYERTAEGLQENYTVRTAVSYLQEKGRQVLVIDSRVEGELYATYIYQEEGRLKELFTRKEDFTGLAGGQELVELDTFAVERPEENLLQFDVSADGQEETFFIRMAVDGTAAGDGNTENVDESYDTLAGRTEG